MKILIAEDSDFARVILNGLFNDLGFNFKIVENGKDAFDSFKDESYDIVFMDIEMPIMDGKEAAIKIREELKISKSQLPIIAMTAHRDSKFINNLVSTVFNDSISKDFRKEEFIDMINKFVIDDVKSNSIFAENNSDYYNLNYLKELTDSDNELTFQILSSFIESAEKFYQDIQLAIRSPDFEKIRFLSHKFSSQVSYIGNKKAIEMIDEIESLSRKKENIDRINILISNSQKIIYSIIVILKKDFSL